MKKITTIFVLLCGFALFSAEFMLKLPVPSQVQVTEANGIITVEASFKPSRALNAQMNRRIDRKHAERICIEGLKRFFNIGTGSLKYSQLQSVGSPSYTDEKAVYVFSLPKSAVRITPGQLSNQNNGGITSEKQQGTLSISTKPASQNSNALSNVIISETCAQSTNETARTSSAMCNLPLSRQIITDAEIEKLPAMGYSVRLMKDCQTMIEIKNEELELCRQQADFDTLVKLPTLLEECRENINAEKIKIQHKFDPQLTGGDLVKITDYVACERKRLQKDIFDFYTILKEKITSELMQSKIDLENLLKTNANDESVKDELDIVNDCLTQINKITINP